MANPPPLVTSSSSIRPAKNIPMQEYMLDKADLFMRPALGEQYDLNTSPNLTGQLDLLKLEG